MTGSLTDHSRCTGVGYVDARSVSHAYICAVSLTVLFYLDVVLFFGRDFMYRFSTILVCVLLTVSQASGDPIVDRNVLFIGDSISTSSASSRLSYGFEHVKNQRPDWTVAWQYASNSQNLLDALSSEPTSFYQGRDAIYFNTGLHSLVATSELTHESLETYEANLNQIVAKLKTLVDPGTHLIWRSTTPIEAGASRGRDPLDVPIYNAVASSVMTSHGIQIDDMYEFLLPLVGENAPGGNQYIVSDHTHWSTWAQETILSPHVIETIESSAPEPTSGLLSGGLMALLFGRRFRRD